MRQMYSSICQMQKERQKLLKIILTLNPSMVLKFETIVKIVKTRYGLYALRCVEGYAGIDYIQSISLPRSLLQITLSSFCPPHSNILSVSESHHSTKFALGNYWHFIAYLSVSPLSTSCCRVPIEQCKPERRHRQKPSITAWYNSFGEEPTWIWKDTKAWLVSLSLRPE